MVLSAFPINSAHSGIGSQFHFIWFFHYWASPWCWRCLDPKMHMIGCQLLFCFSLAWAHTNMSKCGLQSNSQILWMMCQTLCPSVIQRPEGYKLLEHRSLLFWRVSTKELKQAALTPIFNRQRTLNGYSQMNVKYKSDIGWYLLCAFVTWLNDGCWMQSFFCINFYF